MKKLLAALLCTLTILLCAASALAYGDSATLDTPPAEVIQHLAEKYADYTLEDYILIPGTSGGDYGFAMISSGAQRLLVGYRAENGRLKLWRRCSGAVPQGEGMAYFQRHQASDAAYGNNLGFTVNYFAPGYGETASHTASYHWQNGGFKLFAYSDLAAFEGFVDVADSGVTFRDSVKVVGAVNGTVQRDIRYASFSVLPKTLAAAQKKLTTAPAIPAGTLTAQNVQFTGGQKYDVYSAPDDRWALRGADGKAAVSTNDWIQVFGEEDGWLLIQYAIDKDHMRFGYIPAEALPKNASVKTLNWQPQMARLTHKTTLTDDPLFSRDALFTLPEGAPVTELAQMGDWVYIESSTGDFLRGFVKRSDLTTDRIFHIADHSDQRAAGTLTIAASGWMTLDMTASAANAPVAYRLRDELQNIDIGQAALNAKGSYELQGQLPESVSSISFIPVNGDGNLGEALFVIEW